jgi:hypothetical protein
LVKKTKTAFGLQALNYGLPTTNGLLVGIQGTEKSLAAKKLLLMKWQLPLLRS